MSVDIADRTGTIRRSLRVLLISEVGGIETFAGAARTANPKDRDMWDALHALEVQTKRWVDEHLGDLAEEFSRGQTAAKLLGRTAGVTLGHLPRNLQMRSLTEGTKAFMPHFQRLAQHFSATPDGDFYHYVVAHENAIALVGRRNLNHEADPLAEVEALLSGPWSNSTG